MKTKSLANECLVLLSGGPDSAVAAYLYHNKGYKIHSLTLINRERRSNCTEVECAKMIALKINAKQTFIDLSFITETFKEFPNMVFSVGGNAGGCCPPNMITAPLSVETMHIIAMMYAVAHNIKTIIWSMHQDDLETESLSEFQEYLLYLTKIVRIRTKKLCLIETPFLTTSKSDVLLLGKKLGVSFEQTFSCAESESFVHCGKCYQCTKRIAAFKKARIIDTAQFLTSKKAVIG